MLLRMGFYYKYNVQRFLLNPENSIVVGVNSLARQSKISVYNNTDNNCVYI